ncbi:MULTISPECIES: hypothetical protein [Ralstonia]|jgi:hypothetical protein|uniref:Right handed beta helix domain-containing protein n=2 Tax=Pseudomonadota TaxID=1224 RepID=R0EC32_RALPI|nr:MULTISPECIES: hypothetical protein [Ralstonia]ENZ79639.1 hypothetical protein OR214_00056 [Ralstonia pickettii OR214]MBL4778398.1 hypothetical protein [Ralstonia sp.]MCM3582173.1 hypothetical protein [Ralstonia pickettii]
MKKLLILLLVAPMLAFAQVPASTTLATISALRTNVTAYPSVYVNGYYAVSDGGQGGFTYQPNDTSSADNGGTVIVDAAGHRFYRDAKPTTPFQFGAICNGAINNGADDTLALQNWLNWIQGSGQASEGSAGSGYMPAGYACLTSSPLKVSTPVTIKFDSWIYYSGTSGSAFVIGSDAPTNGRNSGYDISLAGLRATNGNLSSPISIQNGGSVGVEVRNMQFSKLHVGQSIAFTYAGIFFNSTNNVYTGQHIQDNSIHLGQIAYNGYGILALSASAADGAVQANDISVQNTFANFANLQLDSALYNSNTNNNIIAIDAMDLPAPGGQSGNVFGSYNKITFGYISGKLQISGVAYNNRIEILNPPSTGSGIVYSTSSGNSNWAQMATPSPNALPTTKNISAGVTYQNTYGVPIFVAISVQLQATSNSNQVAAAYIGQQASTMQTVNYAQAYAAASPTPFVAPLYIVVPPGWYYSFNSSGSGTASFSAASITQAG